MQNSANLPTSKRRFEGKRVLLTGCVANIGLATAELFAREGASIFLVDVNSGVAVTAAHIRSLGSPLVGYATCDVGDPAAVEQTVNQAVAELGGLDIIINNAGIQRSGLAEEFSIEDWNATMRINAGSCFFFAKYGIPHLKKSPAGVIINTSSIAGTHGGPPSLSGYSASKGAIIAFTKVLAKELGPYGIRVNAIAPGWVDTTFNNPVIDFLGGQAAVDADVSTNVPLRRQGKPSEIASAIAYLASDDSSYMTGQALIINGGAG